MTYDMIIFDIDGTLWDVADLVVEACNNASSYLSIGNKLTRKEIDSAMGLGLDDFAKKLYPDIDFEKAKEIIALAMKNLNDLINENGGSAYEGVIDTIKYLSTKYKLGIVTNNNDNYAKLIIDKLNLKEYFTDYMGASSYNMTKGEAIRKMADKNNSKMTLYIGDIVNDMIAANEANVDFIHARYGFDKNKISDNYIEKISDLKNIL